MMSFFTALSRVFPITLSLLLMLGLAAPVFATPASATYELTFEGTWSSETHPTDFPSDAHFSKLVGATHDATASLWNVGELASPGIQNIAEGANKTPLDQEVATLIDQGSACEYLVAPDNIAESPGITEFTFTVTQKCPLLSLVSMIAPSPDWFIGVSGVEFYDGNAWVQHLVLPVLPYDAGSDLGTTFKAANSPATLPEPISLLTIDPFLLDGEILPLGRFIFTKL